MTARGNILAVDDTADSLRLLTGILKADGYEVRSAISGELALRAARAITPDLVLLDLRMPDMDGYEVCRRLKAYPATRGVPVIFVSAATETGEKVRGLELGAVDFVTKPYQRDELLARVRTHLELNYLRNHLEDMVTARTAELQTSEAALRIAENSLRDANADLEIRIQLKLAELRKKDVLLIEQSRLASMGEMIGNIAHQWRQPLNALGLYCQNLQLDFVDGKLDDAEMQSFVSKSRSILNSMSHTIDDFRHFLQPGGDRVAFDVHKTLAQAVALFQASYSSCGIALRISSSCRAAECNRLVYGIPNQFTQVLLNVLGNAKNILVERHISGATIDIACVCQEDSVAIVIGDNAGGIAAAVMPRIFDPYFTTRATSAGLGLYMAKMIMDQMNGSIEARNGAVGAEFSLTLPAVGPDQRA